MIKHVRGRLFDTLQQLAAAFSKRRAGPPTEWFAQGLNKLPKVARNAFGRAGNGRTSIGKLTKK